MCRVTANNLLQGMTLNNRRLIMHVVFLFRCYTRGKCTAYETCVRMSLFVCYFSSGCHLLVCDLCDCIAHLFPNILYISRVFIIYDGFVLL